MIENVLCSGDSLNSWLTVTISSSTAFLSSTTRRRPTRSFDSSLASEIVSIWPVFTRCLMRSRIVVVLIWNGTSVNTSCLRPFFSSTWYFARQVTAPRPLA